MTRTSESRTRMTRESNTEKLAANAIEKKFLQCGGHEFEMIRNDKGRDERVIWKRNGYAVGYSTSLQFKGTQSIVTTAAGFKFPIEVKNIVLRSEGAEPAYYLVHDCKSDKTYYREAHSLAEHMDQCRPEWRNKKKVALLFGAHSMLTAESLNAMLEEASA